MKTAEDEAFDEIERRQGGGFPAKRAMAADRDALFEKFEVEQQAQEQRKWVSLTPKQVNECLENSYFHTAWSSEIDMEMLVNNIDAALQKLNT